MKKIYSKPEIVFEDFSLSTNIAGNCELDTPLPSLKDSCGYPIRGAVVFTDGINACTYKPQDGMHNGFCYHVPTEYNNLFNS
jgi:hypothetical protein